MNTDTMILQLKAVYCNLARQNSQHAAIWIQMRRVGSISTRDFSVLTGSFWLQSEDMHIGLKGNNNTPRNNQRWHVNVFLYFAFLHCSSDYRNRNCQAPSSSSFVSPPEPPADGPAAEHRRSQTEQTHLWNLRCL